MQWVQLEVSLSRAVKAQDKTHGQIEMLLREIRLMICMRLEQGSWGCLWRWGCGVIEGSGLTIRKMMASVYKAKWVKTRYSIVR